MAGNYSQRSNDQQYQYTTEPSTLLNNDTNDQQYHQQYYQQDIESHQPMYVYFIENKKFSSKKRDSSLIPLNSYFFIYMYLFI